MGLLMADFDAVREQMARAFLDGQLPSLPGITLTRHLCLSNPLPLTEPLTHWADGTPIKGALGMRTLTTEQEKWILDEVTR